MAYNLRTGLIGSGDIDVNVSLTGITADNITSGIFGTARIPNLDATKITSGTFTSADRIPALPTSKINSGTFAKSIINSTGEWATTDIPNLSADKITSGTFASADRIPNLDATKITSGTFTSADRIPALPTSKITSGTFAKSIINGDGEWATTDIPNLSADKITSDILNINRIPNIPTSMIIQGPLTCDSLQAHGHVDINGYDLVDVNELKFEAANTGNKITGDSTYKTAITNCDLSSVTNVMPASANGVIAYRAVNANYRVDIAVSTSYMLIDSNTRMTFTVPSSQMVEIELSMYISGLSSEVAVSRLVVGGTSTEFSEDVIDDDTLTPTTEGTYVAHLGTPKAGTSDQFYSTTKWLLKFPSAQVGYTKDIDVQVKCATTSGSFSISYGGGRSRHVSTGHFQGNSAAEREQCLHARSLNYKKKT